MSQPNKKILIAEDDKDFLWMLHQSFDGQPFAVSYAHDGQEALELAKKEQPDIMIVDIMMPKMDGIEMVKKAKEEGVTAQVIFLTNLHDPEHISKAIETVTGADYIVKADVKLNAIVDRVKNKLGL